MAAGATTAEEAVQRAYQLHRAGRSQEAASRLVAAIRTYPRLPAPYKLLADVQRSLGNRTAEAAVLEELTSLEPLNAVAWRRVAELKAERGSSEEAYRGLPPCLPPVAGGRGSLAGAGHGGAGLAAI